MIYIIKHKEYDNPIPDDYKELWVGEKGHGWVNLFNPYINEATGLYNIWLDNNDDIVGLVHYRRMFYYKNDYLKLKDAEKILKDNDIIITNDVVFDKGIYEQLRSEIENPDVLDKYYELICKEEPQFKEFMKLKQFNPKEMFVCKRELLAKYVDWLHDLIIPIVVKFICEDANKVVNKRMIGHLVERLFAYWIWKNDLKCYKMEYIDI